MLPTFYFLNMEKSDSSKKRNYPVIGSAFNHYSAYLKSNDPSLIPSYDDVVNDGPKPSYVSETVNARSKWFVDEFEKIKNNNEQEDSMVEYPTMRKRTPQKDTAIILGGGKKIKNISEDTSKDLFYDNVDVENKERLNGKTNYNSNTFPKTKKNFNSSLMSSTQDKSSPQAFNPTFSRDKMSNTLDVIHNPINSAENVKKYSTLTINKNKNIYPEENEEFSEESDEESDND
jgi:hypothetical protein